MELGIDDIPVGILTVLSLLAPYAVSALNGVLPFVTKPIHRKLVTIAVSVVVSAISVAAYITMTGDWPENWPAWLILSLGVISAAYGLLLKSSADKVESAVVNAQE